MKVAALRSNPGKPGSDLADKVYSPEQKQEMLADADFVVSVLPGTEATANFFGAAEFASMKPSSVFISVGRGTVVDEDALADALASGSIAGAALDVFKVEPLPADSRLWGCDNLLLTAHNADYTDDYFQLGWDVWRSNFDSLASGGSLVTPVDKASGY